MENRNDKAAGIDEHLGWRGAAFAIFTALSALAHRTRRHHRPRIGKVRARSVTGLFLANLIAACSGGTAGSPASQVAPSAVAPSITSQPQNTIVTVGQTASFAVTAVGTAPLAYQWRAGGSAIAGAVAASYTTAATSAADSGETFSVVVTNAAGTVTSGNAILTVSPPGTSVAPSITAQPKNATVTAGQAAAFSVVAIGTAPLAYQWRVGGSAIAGATAASYTIATTSAADSGEAVSVVVTNSAGTVTSGNAILTVTPAGRLSITTSTLPGGFLQSAYAATLQATGGKTPYAWTVVSGQLPAGLVLSQTTGTISGTPTTVENSSFTVSVHDAAGASATLAASISIGAASATAPFGHVVIVVEENANYASVVGETAAMPYLNSLITSYGLATQYYSNTHPSIGNYMMLVTGQVLTNDDSETPATFPVSANNAVRELAANGKSWKAYAEDIPSVGYTGGDTGNYAVRHVPLAYLTDVQDSAAGRATLVPFTQFATDLASGSLPNYSFVTPNLCDDAHNCALSVADAWLKTNIAPLLTSVPFKDDGVLIIVFDESANDDTDGGGRIAAVVISPKFSKAGDQSTTFYQHESTLGLMLQGLGIKIALPGAAATAPTMWEFFSFTPP
jgi:phosphatidylinositol-3-phosphatase